MNPGEIRVLPRLVVDQIAAGEVVDRPAAVVRELLDNALDAGATAISVEIEAGGRALLRVSDDGCGIRAAEVPLAFAAHATSKLRTAEDLEHVATLGFRGEALSSIGAVARVRVRSAVAGAPHGAELDCEGGTLSAVRPAARAPGTDVEVRDLFFNTPARRRFLRRDATESGHAVDEAIRHALAHPEVSFRVRVDGRSALDCGASESQRERIRRAFGTEVDEDLRPLSERSPSVSVEGFVGGPASARSDASGVFFFVNGRFVRDRGALRVLRDATRDVLGARQPTAFLFLSIDPALVDVNIHPAKAEVRFREPSAVYGMIHRAVRRALEETRPAESPERLLRPSFSAAFPADIVRERPAPSLLEDAPMIPAAARYLRAFDTFLVLESPDGLEIVDQHALAERVTFEDLRRRAKEGGIALQPLLIPEVFDLPPGDLALAEECAEVWRAAGLEAELYGPGSIAVRSVPAGLRRLRLKELLDDLLALAREGKRPPPEQLLEEVLHRCACRSSVMAGDALSDEEIRSLLERAARLPADQTCPHGRPTRIRLTRRDLDRAFERT